MIGDVHNLCVDIRSLPSCNLVVSRKLCSIGWFAEPACHVAQNLHVLNLPSIFLTPGIKLHSNKPLILKHSAAARFARIDWHREDRLLRQMLHQKQAVLISALMAMLPLRFDVGNSRFTLSKCGISDPSLRYKFSERLTNPMTSENQRLRRLRILRRKDGGADQEASEQ